VSRAWCTAPVHLRAHIKAVAIGHFVSQARLKVTSQALEALVNGADIHHQTATINFGNVRSLANDVVHLWICWKAGYSVASLGQLRYQQQHCPRWGSGLGGPPLFERVMRLDFCSDSKLGCCAPNQMMMAMTVTIMMATKMMMMMMVMMMMMGIWPEETWGRCLIYLCWWHRKRNQNICKQNRLELLRDNCSWSGQYINFP